MNCLNCHSEVPDYAAFCPQCGEQLPNREEPNDYKYVAFISYRHTPRDTKVAKQVQKAVETFKLPRSVLEKAEVTTFSSVPSTRTLGKCFRDEDELAASHSLPTTIQEALAASHTLILICSPETQSSSWVQQEIETFAAIHGQDRIICALADGESKSSIPAILRNQATPSLSRTLHGVSTSPLAADLRSKSHSKRKSELIRIIAAVTGLDYDDLRRRDQIRKRRQWTLGFLAMILLLTFAAGLSLQLHKTHETALVEESKNLTNQALEQYEQGNYVTAITTILKALPSSESDNSRPLVPEAQTALEKILAINADPDSLWQLLFAYDLEGDIVDFTYSQEGGWVAVLDTTGMIYIYDMDKGSLLVKKQSEVFTVENISNPNNDWTLEALSSSKLYVANQQVGFICYSVPTMSELWSSSMRFTLGVEPGKNTEDFALLYFFAHGLVTGVIDSLTGDLIQSTGDYVNPTSERFYGNSFCATDNLSAAYCGIDNTLMMFDLEAGKCQTSEITETIIQSTKATDDYVIVAAAEIENEEVDVSKIPFELCAINPNDAEKSPLWKFTDTYSATIDDHDDTKLKYNSPPTIRSIFSCEKETTIVTAGKTLMTIDVESGEMPYVRDFDSSIVEAQPFIMRTGDKYLIPVILSNGTLDLVTPPSYSTLTSSNAGTTKIPHLIDKGLLDICFGVPVAFVRAYDQPNRFMCYLARNYVEDSPHNQELSLNELLARAHALVSKG